VPRTTWLGAGLSGTTSVSTGFQDEERLAGVAGASRCATWTSALALHWFLRFRWRRLSVGSNHVVDSADGWAPMAVWCR